MDTHPTCRELRELYGRCGSVSRVASELDVAFETARRWLLEAGVEIKPKGRPSAHADQLDTTELARLYRGGKSIAQLGVQFGVSPGTVRSRLRGAGVELRPRPGWKY